MLNFLPPEGAGPFPVGHPRLDRPGHDLIEATEVVGAVESQGLTICLAPSSCGRSDSTPRSARRVARLPGATGSSGRPSCPPGPRCTRPLFGDLLNVPLRDIGGVMVRRPREPPLRPAVAPRSRDGPRSTALFPMWAPLPRHLAIDSPTRWTKAVFFSPMPAASAIAGSLTAEPGRIGSQDLLVPCRPGDGDWYGHAPLSLTRPDGMGRTCVPRDVMRANSITFQSSVSEMQVTVRESSLPRPRHRDA